MHKNLAMIQDKMVENVREALSILEVPDNKALIISVLAVAENPLARQEIMERTRIVDSECFMGLDALIDRDLVVAEGVNASGESVYGLNPKMEKIAARSIHSKIEALRSNTKKHVAQYESLLESAKGEFDGYDTLMAKFLSERIGKIKLIVALMTRRSSLLRLLDSGDGEGSEIKKIEID
jgi:hypothetical protein